MQYRDVDWHKFWLLEIVILSVPTLLIVFATGGHASVRPNLAELLLVILLALTIINLFLVIHREGDHVHPKRSPTRSQADPQRNDSI